MFGKGLAWSELPPPDLETEVTVQQLESRTYKVLRIGGLENTNVPGPACLAPTHSRFDL